MSAPTEPGQFRPHLEALPELYAAWGFATARFAPEAALVELEQDGASAVLLSFLRNHRLLMERVDRGELPADVVGGTYHLLAIVHLGLFSKNNQVRPKRNSLLLPYGTLI